MAKLVLYWHDLKVGKPSMNFLFAGFSVEGNCPLNAHTFAKLKLLTIFFRVQVLRAEADGELTRDPSAFGGVGKYESWYTYSDFDVDRMIGFKMENSRRFMPKIEEVGLLVLKIMKIGTRVKMEKSRRCICFILLVEAVGKCM